MANAVNLSQKTLFVISGASRGIGRALAVECSAKFAAGSVVVLLARSSTGLEETKCEILERNNNKITVLVHVIDLTRPSSDDLAAIFQKALNGRALEDFGLAMIVHNVGTVGDITKSAMDLGSDAAAWHAYFSLNVFSVMGLNTAFLKNIQQCASSIRTLIVNLTSESGIDPYKNLSMYW